MDELEAIPGYLYATHGSQRLHPIRFPELYHGTCEVSEESMLLHAGLPPAGRDIDLLRHIEPPPDREEASAFRGTVQIAAHPHSRSGAADCAGHGGWVYRIREWPGYDVHALLEGRIEKPDGTFRNPVMNEQEIAVPARVPASHIDAIGRVTQHRGGLRVLWRRAP